MITKYDDFLNEVGNVFDMPVKHKWSNKDYSDRKGETWHGTIIRKERIASFFDYKYELEIEFDHPEHAKGKVEVIEYKEDNKKAWEKVKQGQKIFFKF